MRQTAERGSASNLRREVKAMNKKKILKLVAFVILLIILCLASRIKVY